MPYNYDLAGLDWSPEHVNDSLAEVYDHAVTEARDILSWHDEKARANGQAAKSIRLLAVLSISIGAVGPLISSVWGLTIRPFSSPLSATLFATIAATLLGIDRALGFSRNFVRYGSAADDIRKSLRSFRLKWFAKIAGLNGHPTTAEDLHSLREMAIGFQESVGNIDQAFGLQFRAEFEKRLADIQTQAEELKSKRENRA